MSPSHIIVIGGSAGSYDAIHTILAAFPADLPVAVFIVRHVPIDSPNYFVKLLAKRVQMRVKSAEHNAPITAGTIYTAIPNHHLLVERNRIRLSQTPRENLARPAIDPLFVTAAAAYGSAVTGVVLSGLLNDGARGLQVITRHGGTAIVQHPEDAQMAEMPLAALAAVKDTSAPLYILPAYAIGEQIVQTISTHSQKQRVQQVSWNESFIPTEKWVQPNHGRSLRQAEYAK